MANQSKPPLKLVVSGSNFHKELSLHQRIKLHWSEPLESHIRNFSSGVWGWSAPPPPPPPWGLCQVYHNVSNLKPKINFIHVLTIEEDILGAFGALHL